VRALHTSHFLQSGTSLSNDLGYMGSIDPDTGQFSLFAPSTQCGAVDTMYGYASADNLRFDATGVVWVVNTGPRPPTPCLIADIVITGTRCGNGLVDSGEAREVRARESVESLFALEKRADPPQRR